MGLRDITVTILVFASLPFCFKKPWIGILVWSWIGFMNPHRLGWGFAFSMPFAQMVAIATVLGLVSGREKFVLPRSREVMLLLLMWGYFLFTTFFAINQFEAWDQFIKVTKILVLSLFMTVLLQERTRLRLLMCVIAFSIGFFGLKGGVWAITTGGGNMVLGPPGTFISGNTEIGLALNMVLPFFVYLMRDEKIPYLKWLWRAMFVFSIVAILITYSRGALLGLGVVLTMLFLKSRLKFAALLMMALAVPILLSTLPEKWFGRMETIQSYEQDRSAVNRIRAWKVSYRMALDRPITGYGFRPFSREMYLRYDPEYGPRSGDAHSIFFQVLAEHGFVGLGLYCGLILSALLTLWRVRRFSRRSAELNWANQYSSMIQASIFAYVANGAFLSMSYFDLFYALIAITVLLERMVYAQLAQDRAPPVIAVGQSIPALRHGPLASS
jgi:probable O-glycosylation ligase (exosortase A-associated)